MQVFQGLITSADWVYHLERLGPDRYRCAPPGKPRPLPFEVAIEDAIMRPLVSGLEAKRYQTPQTKTWLLFPYALADERVSLIPVERMRQDYPKAWAYLISHKAVLEMREAKRDSDGMIRGPMYDEHWYRFGRHQSINKQHLPKLVIPRLVSHLACTVDEHGTFCLDNVDVGGVLVAEGKDSWFLSGVLNAPVADWVFRRISKPFRGDYRSANKQFIAPLPIPHATGAQRAAVAAGGRDLQRLHTERRDLLAAIARRLGSVRTRARLEHWLFAGLLAAPDREADAPAGLDTAERRAWARNAYETDLQARWDTLGSAVRPGVALDAELVDGELRFLVEGLPVLDRIFVPAKEGAFLLAQWKLLASTLTVTERLDGKALSKKLRTLASSDNPAVIEQVVDAAGALSRCEAAIRTAEAAVNEAVFTLYGLTPAERALVEGG